MYVIWLILFALGILFLFINAYLWFLAFASFLPERRKAPDGAADGAAQSASETRSAEATRFAVIVPAHNESKVIQRTLDSLGELDYPADRVEVVVVADNCTDDTAAIVARNAVRCLERTNPDERGKGFALDWALKQLADDPFEAAVIIDADTITARDFLTQLDLRVRQGEKAIQGFYDVIDPESSPMTSLSYLGFVLNRSLRYKGRSRLGGSSNLLGNGMCFTRDITDRFGWPAKSVVEDLEFEIVLNLNGIRVAFVPEARIFAEIPGTFKESATQRTRWDLGKFAIRNKYLWPLIEKGLTQFRIGCLDRALELFIPPYSILWVLAFVLFVLAAATTGLRFDPLMGVWSAGIGASVLYVLLGLVVAQAGWRIYRNLLYAPFFILWRVKIILQGYFAKTTERWIKTER